MFVKINDVIVSGGVPERFFWSTRVQLLGGLAIVV